MTGASKGIGKRTAIAFAEAGASQIAIGARSALDQVEQAVLEGAKLGGHPPPRVLKIRLDVMDLANVEAAAEATLQEFGGLDILINNAGYLEEFRPLAESDPKEWWRTWEMNVRGVYFCLRAFLPILKRGGEKTIINIGSIGAHHFMPGVRFAERRSRHLSTDRLLRAPLTRLRSSHCYASQSLSWYAAS